MKTIESLVMYNKSLNKLSKELKNLEWDFEGIEYEINLNDILTRN